MNKFILLALVVLSLAACQSKTSTLDGTYVSDADNRSFTFKPDGTFTERAANGIVVGGKAFSYHFEGDQIKLEEHPLAQLTLQKDGSIDGGIGYGHLIKQAAK